jgi:hypothetical protein
MLAYAISIGSFVLIDYLDGGLEYLKPGEEAPPMHHGSFEPTESKYAQPIAYAGATANYNVSLTEPSRA